MRRHRRAVAVAAVLSGILAASLVAGVMGVRREARRAEAERDKARLAAQKAEAISAYIQKMLSSADPRAGNRDVTVAQALDDAVVRAETELRNEPEVQAAVQATIGQTYEGLGLYDKAEVLIGQALETRRRHFGPAHADVAKTLSLQAGVQKAKGDFAGAERSYRAALDLFGSLGEGDSLDALLAKGALAGTLQALGRLDDAEALHREVLAGQRTLLGNDDAIVAATLNNLAVVLGSRGDWVKAEPLHRESLAIMRKVHGPEHVEVAAALRTLASVSKVRASSRSRRCCSANRSPCPASCKVRSIPTRPGASTTTPSCCAARGSRPRPRRSPARWWGCAERRCRTLIRWSRPAFRSSA